MKGAFVIVFLIILSSFVAGTHEIGSYANDPTANLYEYMLNCLKGEAGSIIDYESLEEAKSTCRDNTDEHSGVIKDASKSKSDNCGVQLGRNTEEAVECWRGSPEAKRWIAMYTAPCSGTGCQCVGLNQYGNHHCEEIPNYSFLWLSTKSST